MLALGEMLSRELVVLSLGSSVDEWYNAAPHMRSASLFQQQLGCVTPETFGTLGTEQPPNLLIVVWGNECYASIGGPPTHTAFGRVDLTLIVAKHRRAGG